MDSDSIKRHGNLGICLDTVNLDTAAYYDKNAENFYETTVKADMWELREKFLAYLPQFGEILDLGCGSGRDSLAFMKAGFKVTSMDPSEKMCQYTAELTGKECLRKTAQEIDWQWKFDGVWACASLLHVGEEDTPSVYAKIHRALKGSGILFVTYKYGKGEITRGDRFFHDMNEGSLETLVESIKSFEIKEMWTTSDVRPGRDQEKWLNAILQRID